MKTLRIAAVAAAAVLGVASANAAPLSEWTGNWENPNGDIVAVSIADEGGAITVSAKGKCTPNPCDWGPAAGVAYSPSAATDPAGDTQAIIAVFEQGFARKTMLLDGRAGNTLRVHVFTQFTDDSGRSDYVLHGALRRARTIARPVGPLVARPQKTFNEDCLPLDPDAVSVGNRNGSWKLVQGSRWLLDAGANKAEMDAAKALVQHYGLDKHCFVGRPDPSLSYWLVGDAAPEGAFPGEDCVSINPNNLTVRDSGSRFTIVSNGNHFAFTAPTKAEAEDVIAVIKYYGFTRSCFVGRPDPSMSYLRK